MSELKDKLEKLDKVEPETFTTDYTDTVKIPSQYRKVISEHRKSLIDIKNDLVKKTALLEAEQMKIDCLLTFFNKTMGETVNLEDAAHWNIDEKASTATFEGTPNESEDDTKE